LDQGIDGLRLYYAWRSRYAEADAACRAAVECLEAMTTADARRVWAKLAAIWSYFRVEAKQMDAASQLARQSLDVLEELEAKGNDVRPEKALAQFHVARMTFYPDPAGATPWYEQSLALYEALDDGWGMARALASLGWVAENLGHYGEAQALTERSLTIRQELGDQRGIADSLLDLGLLSWVQGDLEEAEALFRRCLAIYREIDDRARIAYGIKNVGEALVRQGRFAEGLSLMEESIEIFKDMGYRHGVSWVTPFLGEAKAHLGWYEPSREDGQLALVVSREVGRSWNLAFSQLVRSLPQLAEGLHGEAQAMLQESEAVFREIKHRENLGWVLGPLGLADRSLGQLSEARAHVSEAMQIAAELGAFMPFLYALPAAALLLSDQGQQIRAVELYALGSRYGFMANSRWFQDVAGQQLAAVAATVPEDVVEAAQQRGRTRDWRVEAAGLPGELGGTVENVRARSSRI
jgi:tetratricopeptide (TPR) repeat protein